MVLMSVDAPHERTNKEAESLPILTHVNTGPMSGLSRQALVILDPYDFLGKAISLSLRDAGSSLIKRIRPSLFQPPLMF